MKNKYLFTSMGFLTGLFLGISIIGLFSFTKAPFMSAPGGGIVPISSSDAHNYYKNFQSNATPFNQVINGFTIDKAQLDAMNSISRENPELMAFRIYMGKDNNSKKIAVVVGVDDAGKDAIRNTIFNTAMLNLSPCPPVCDVSSPIISE